MKAGLLLLALGCAAVLAACGSGGEKTVVVTQTVGTQTQPQTTTTATTTTTQTSTLPPPPPGRTVHRRIFRTPSANIGCAIAGGSVRCDIRERDWSPPPKPADCEVDFGQGLEVGGGVPAGFVCAGDTALGSRFPVLPYGTSSRIGAITCTSRRPGITCTDSATGHGFFLSRQRYSIF